MSGKVFNVSFRLEKPDIDLVKTIKTVVFEENENLITLNRSHVLVHKTILSC